MMFYTCKSREDADKGQKRWKLDGSLSAEATFVPINPNILSVHLSGGRGMAEGVCGWARIRRKNPGCPRSLLSG